MESKIIIDYMIYEDDQPVLYERDDYEEFNDVIKEYDRLYKSGILTKIADYSRTVRHKNKKLIAFVVKVNKLRRYSDLKISPLKCAVTGCTSLANIMFFEREFEDGKYHSVCETEIAYLLNLEQANEIVKIRKTQGIIPCAIKAIIMSCDDLETKI